MAKTAIPEVPILTAYCMTTKKKGVQMLNAMIDVNNNRYIAKGVDEAGNKMTTILGKEKAEFFIKNKDAKKGKGW